MKERNEQIHSAVVPTMERFQAPYKVSEPIEEYSRPFCWRENCPDDGEAWLRKAAASGDCFAMERLGQRLFEGIGLVPQRAEGIDWLTQAIALGSVSAKYTLAVWLLENLTHNDGLEAIRLLEDSARAGFLSAQTELGMRLLSGESVPTQVRQGRLWIQSAAVAGDRLAAIVLGRWLVKGKYLPADTVEGRAFLARAGASSDADIPRLGVPLYDRALNAPTPSIRRRLLDEVVELFLEGHDAGSLGTSLNLAYMIRRGEASGDRFPPLEVLLERGLRSKKPFAVMNEALRRALGVQCVSDWHQADQFVSELRTSTGIIEWWGRIARRGESEGNLVLGWLVRHGLAADPDGMEPCRRFALLAATHVRIPHWMGGYCDHVRKR